MSRTLKVIFISNMSEGKKIAVKDSEFGNLLKEYFGKISNVGDIVKGKIIDLDKGAVRLDINGLTAGIVRGEELYAESNEFTNLKIGDEVEATVIEQENESGELELSFRSAGQQRVWDRVAQYLRAGTILPVKVLDANKGGLIMQIGALAGFMPVSQLNPDHYPRVPGGDKLKILEQLRKLVGQELQVKVIDINQNEEKLIVSEKAVWEDEQKSVLESYKIGDVIEGEVTALTSFGAFIKFGEGLEGLAHISEIVWQRIDHPKDMLKIGELVKAQVIDLNKSKIYLSLKRLVDDPWKTVKERYQVGQVVSAEVHKIEPFGLMVKLDKEIHGLAHISELSDTPIRDLEQLKTMFAVGQSYPFEIVNMEPAEHRLGLKLEGVKGKKREEKIVEEKLVKEEENNEIAK